MECCGWESSEDFKETKRWDKKRWIESWNKENPDDKIKDKEAKYPAPCCPVKVDLDWKKLKLDKFPSEYLSKDTFNKTCPVDGNGLFEHGCKEVVTKTLRLKTKGVISSEGFLTFVGFYVVYLVCCTLGLPVSYLFINKCINAFQIFLVLASFRIIYVKSKNSDEEVNEQLAMLLRTSLY